MVPIRKLISMYLLYISGLDDTGYREIYKTYMHFGRIAYSGKQSVVGTPSNLVLI